MNKQPQVSKPLGSLFILLRPGSLHVPLLFYFSALQTFSSTLSFPLTVILCSQLLYICKYLLCWLNVILCETNSVDFLICISFNWCCQEWETVKSDEYLCWMDAWHCLEASIGHSGLGLGVRVRGQQFSSPSPKWGTVAGSPTIKAGHSLALPRISSTCKSQLNVISLERPFQTTLQK